VPQLHGHGGKQQSQSASRAVWGKNHRRHGRFAFLTLKGGFVNFRLDPRPATFGTFTDSVTTCAQTTSVGGYPAQVWRHLGPIGLRLEAGDEIYFAEARTQCARSLRPFIVSRFAAEELHWIAELLYRMERPLFQSEEVGVFFRMNPGSDNIAVRGLQLDIGALSGQRANLAFGWTLASQLSVLFQEQVGS